MNITNVHTTSTRFPQPGTNATIKTADGNTHEVTIVSTYGSKQAYYTTVKTRTGAKLTLQLNRLGTYQDPQGLHFLQLPEPNKQPTIQNHP